jgi:hypothetical protein
VSEHDDYADPVPPRSRWSDTFGPMSVALALFAVLGGLILLAARLYVVHLNY